MKKFYFFILLIFSVTISAQMDTEHWFAPVFDSSNSGQIDPATSGDYLYLSTDKTTPFEVIIYSGNVEIDRVSISRGSPIYVKIPNGIVTTTNTSDTFVSRMKGLHLVGDYKFFANLRILRRNHAEIINSKGLAALGKTFYGGMSQLYANASYYNSQLCIIATENNTKVDITGFDPDFTFSDGNTYPSGISITLQRGESYIVTAPYSPPAMKGLIGAKIESTFPISITNGNFTGTYISGTNTDILMDQSVPTDRLGADYIVAKGNGLITPTALDDMERVLVIATNPDNPTDIYVNGVFYKTLNAGDFDFVYSDSYKDIDGSGNYSMSIKAAGGEIYVYQFLAGTDDPGSTNATGGMNLIPSLNCFLPNNIIELAELSQIGPRNDFNTKVNIISETGANVFLNGAKLTGHPIPDNPDWELFVEKNITGNVSVISDRAATAGIASGNGAVGFGGYFAGFSSIPAISKTGDCAKGQRLEVDDGYDFYSWEHNGVPLASGATLSSIDPVSYYPSDPKNAEGIYVCTVTKIGCGFKTTNAFIYLNCPDLVSLPPFTIGNCQSTEPILVEFSGNPSKNVNFSSIVVTQLPPEGTVSPPYIDSATGKIYIKYSADNTSLSSVTFKYYFEDTDTYPDSEEVTVTVNIAQIKLENKEDTQCLDFDGKGIYNLKSIFEQAANLDPTYVKYEYYKDPGLTQKIPETDPNPDNEAGHYKSEPNKTVYVKVTNSYGCDNQSEPAEILLRTFELPVINTIDTKSNTVVINVTKGKPVYKYYILKDGPLDYLPADNLYQVGDSTFYVSERGIYTAYVKSADDCNPVTKKFAIVGIFNVITPNNDGKNDVIDMSLLAYKVNPKFQVFDRNGKKVFESSAHNFIWNGKENNRPLPTGTYWYMLQWQDYDNGEAVTASGWILLKNRN